MLGGSEADFKLILTAEDGWHSSFFGMGSGGSKQTDNVVANTVDFSTNMSKDFAVLRLHGGTSALVAGVAASAVLCYMAYRLFMWKKTKMGQARRRAPQGEGHIVWANPWRVDIEDGERQGRLARRLPAAFRPPSLPRCSPCRVMWTFVTNVERRQDMMSSEDTSSPSLSSQQFTLCRSLWTGNH